MSTWVGALDTPAPLVDVNRLESNLGRMARRLASTSARHRPHTKTHKTRQVAERQMAHGARGLAVAKLGEAEAMVAAGFDDILIAYPLIGAAKIHRLLPLLDVANVRFTIDSEAGARQASEALAAAGRRADVLIEVEAGARRTGVTSVEEAVRLADLLDSLPGLTLAGVMTFGRGYVDGHAAGALGFWLGSSAWRGTVPTPSLATDRLLAAVARTGRPLFVRVERWGDASAIGARTADLDVPVILVGPPMSMGICRRRPEMCPT